MKTCTYDCVYCQLGRTTCKTDQRREWVPAGAVLAQLRAKLSAAPDFITLSGSGEPTLFEPLARLIDSIRQMTSIPVAVLTNGSLLWREDVRRQLRRADLVMPTLAAGDERSYQRIHRPHASLRFDTVLDGLVRFREEFSGDYWLEIFLLAGVNDSDAQIERLSRCVDRIGPGRVQLNTVARPPAESFAQAVARDRLAKIAMQFSPPAQVVADSGGIHNSQAFAVERDDVLALLRRRPCTTEDIATGLGMHRNAVIKHLETLLDLGQIERLVLRGVVFHRAAGAPASIDC